MGLSSLPAVIFKDETTGGVVEKAAKAAQEIPQQTGDRLDLIMVPKVNRPEDVYVVDTLLTQVEANKGFGRRIGLEVV